MCLSLEIRSTGSSGSLAAWPMEDLAPRQHITVAQRREKERRHLIHPLSGCRAGHSCLL